MLILNIRRYCEKNELQIAIIHRIKYQLNCHHANEKEALHATNISHQRAALVVHWTSQKISERKVKFLAVASRGFAWQRKMGGGGTMGEVLDKRVNG
jgi:hypothetical protein